jgi:uncharacterized membrane protein SpoIIM required for sporulation
VDVDAFAAAHRADWDRLDQLVKRHRVLSGEEIDELVASYQRTATHLSVLRASGADPALVAQLSARLARARAAVSGASAARLAPMTRFATVSFPLMAYRLRWWWLATAAGSLLVALLFGWWVARTPAVQASLLPRSAAAGLVRHQFRDYYSQYAAGSFAAKVWTNNAWVAALALISGMLLGLPTLYLLLLNALNVGVDGGLLVAYGRAGEFFGLILPHGMLELSAVFLAAAAGLRLGWSIVDPGPRPRAVALAQEGRETITIALGLIVVLGVSGLIEAFVTPSSLATWARIGIGGCALGAFLAYVIVLGRRAAAAGESPDIAEAPDILPVAG